ncbi:MAG: hypothetical protein PHP51_04935 [Desulfotomaculaceae bacterium]|nr:hypothetical protein [Desulfotomaculaceae bacterium]MDD4767881.1 hypothetical protein [Desulfotomaculaceae bacterium]
MNKCLVAELGNGVSNFPAVQKDFDEMTIVLLDTFFSNASEDQKKRFIKAGFDKIKYLETLLLQQQGVHLKSIEQSMAIALTRMFRCALIYLPGQVTHGR